MQPANPMEPGAAKCGAQTRTPDKHPCQHEAGWGTSHVGVGRCAAHGGLSPRAEVSGLVQLARREQQVMGAPLSIEPQDAILECIRISAGEVAYASERIAELEASDAAGPVKRTLVRKTDDGTVQEVRLDAPALHIWIQARRSAMDSLVQYSFAALRARIDERRVKLAEQQGALLAQAVHGILRELGVSDLPEAPSVIRKHLVLVSGAA
jgi:hypothetical protein